MEPPFLAAVVLTSIFGTLFFLLFIYYVDRYHHLRYLEVTHWLHNIAPAQWHTPCSRCRGTGVDRNEMRLRSRSSRRRSRSAWRRDERYEGYNIGWYGREAAPVQRPRPAMIMSKNDGYGVNWDEWRTRDRYRRQHLEYTREYEQVVPHEEVQEARHTVPRDELRNPPAVYDSRHPDPEFERMPQQPLHVPVSGSSREHQHERLASERSQASTSQTSSQPSSRPATKPLRRDPRIYQTDYIHIVDDYPEWVKRALNRPRRTKHTARSRRPSFSSSSSSSRSDTSGETEEIPRSAIPGAVPRHMAGG